MRSIYGLELISVNETIGHISFPKAVTMKKKHIDFTQPGIVFGALYMCILYKRTSV